MRRVLLTGANRGIGLEFARQLLDGGDRVIATCRHPGQAGALNALVAAHPNRLHVLPLDVASERSRNELVKELQLVTDGLDVLINNAGVLPSGEHFGSVDGKVLADTFATNTIGPFALAQAVAPMLCKGHSPRIANLSSVLGSITRNETFRTPSYAISKSALNMATMLLARALAEHGVHVVALHPGWVRTEMGGKDAQVEPADAVRGLLTVIASLDARHSGQFIDYLGQPVPW
jgi:NAD(P)-dependent dehydrogenase (short-subunit alcohol dehydrogenase family)